MSRAPWVTHFGFTRTPFSKTTPASQLCDRASHQEAVARIRFCISESLLGVITGEVGVGKPVAVRAATSQLDATAHHIIYVATPTFGARGLYLTIVHALGAKPRAQKADLIAQTQALLAAEEHERRRRVVFIIDEAHLLVAEQLEELRLLTNAEMDSQSPFALLLVGQPTLARQLRLGVFAALDQRIATRYQLAPMDLAEAAQYLRHHLTLVGRTDPIQPSPELLSSVRAAMRDIPRQQVHMETLLRWVRGVLVPPEPFQPATAAPSIRTRAARPPQWRTGEPMTRAVELRFPRGGRDLRGVRLSVEPLGRAVRAGTQLRLYRTTPDRPLAYWVVRLNPTGMSPIEMETDDLGVARLPRLPYSTFPFHGVELRRPDDPAR